MAIFIRKPALSELITLNCCWCCCCGGSFLSVLCLLLVLLVDAADDESESDDESDPSSESDDEVEDDEDDSGDLPGGFDSTGGVLFTVVIVLPARSLLVRVLVFDWGLPTGPPLIRPPSARTGNWIVRYSNCSQ